MRIQVLTAVDSPPKHLCSRTMAIKVLKCGLAVPIGERTILLTSDLSWASIKHQASQPPRVLAVEVIEWDGGPLNPWDSYSSQWPVLTFWNAGVRKSKGVDVEPREPLE